MQTYGFDKLMAFNTLKKMGLLTSREALVALKASVQGRDKYFYENSKLSLRMPKLSEPSSIIKDGEIWFYSKKLNIHFKFGHQTV